MASLSYFVAFIVFIVTHFAGNASASSSATTAFDFGTLSLSTMKLIGDAHLSSGSVKLTRDVGVPYSGAGKVIYSKPIRVRKPGNPSPASFSTFFSFSVTNLNPSSIGGGLAFVVSPDGEYLGEAGGYLGVTGAADSPRSVVAVEFDTLMDVEFKDINGNHVGLDLNSMVSANATDLDAVGVDLKSGDLVNSWVDYSGPAKTIDLYVAYSNLKPKDPLITSKFDLAEILDSDFAYVGFSGSTQGSTEVHSIEWWSFASSFDDDDPNSPPPPTASLMNPSADKAYSTPPSSSPDNGNNTSNSSSPVRSSDGKCHSQLCKNAAGAVVGVVTASAFFLAFCTLCLIWVYNKKYKPNKNRDIFVASDVIKAPKEFSYKELSTATKGFDSNRVIGHGAFGTVYRGTIPSTGEVVAVKRCTNSSERRSEFLSELSIIGTLRHRNLVRLQGWCHEKGESLLVYDLMTNGSLDKALFESRTVLPWPHRSKILLGVASALAYLHQECENQVIHRDVKASNIMLDEGFNARLGDFGLARQVEHDKSPDATVAAGTMGYLAPEYLLTGRASEKTDVFSFGAVALEVASGRRPIEKEVVPVAARVGGKVGPAGSLVEWVWSLHREGRLLEAADPRLGNGFDEGEVRKVLLIGLACSHPDPEARPAMRAVVRMLVGEGEVPAVPRTKPTLSFSTQELILTLQDSVSDVNGLAMEMSTSSSASEVCLNSRGGGGGGGSSSLDMVV